MGGMCLMWRGWRTSSKCLAICNSLAATGLFVAILFLSHNSYSQTNLKNPGTFNKPLTGDKIAFQLQDYTAIIVNEIHYNPSSQQGSDNAFEFIELYNTLGTTIPLLDIEFSEGIGHKFTVTDSIAGFGYLVIARDSTQYPGSIQWDSGSLLNSGETLVLLAPDGTVIDSLFYGVEAPWPAEPNGTGPSLELISPEANNELPESWQSSASAGGSPGKRNSDPVSNEAMMMIEPDTLDFGDVDITTMRQLQFTVKNSGRDTLIIDAISVQPDSDSTFTLTEPMSLPVKIAQNESVAYTVDFSPPDTGKYQSTILVQSQNSTEQTKNVWLFGSGSMYQVSPLESALVISEIHYNPSAEQGSDSDFEFIELFNHTNSAVALNGISFDSGIEHTFTADDTLSGSHFLLLAKNSDPYPGCIQWQTGSLLNSGEKIRLVDADGLVIDEVFYQNTPPWPPEADGEGASLELIAADMDNSKADSWQASKDSGGTPGKPNSDGIQTEITAVSGRESELPDSFDLSQNYPNPFNAGTQIGFQLPVSALISLSIYNIIGERIKTFFDRKTIPAGKYNVNWYGRDDNGLAVGSGVYFYRFNARHLSEHNQYFTDTGRMILLK